MPIDETMLRTIGFVVPNGYIRPNATCFLVTVGCDIPDHRHGYVVTAEHCVMEKDVAIWMNTVAGIQDRTYAPESWVYDSDHDIALAEWHDAADARNWMGMLAEDVPPPGVETMLHDEIVYAGLYKPIPSLAQMGRPVVRSGSVSALGIPDVKLDSGRVIKTANLIEIRSRKGFSGAPCWLHKSYIYTDKVVDNPDSYVGQETRIFGWGMLVGYDNEMGLGVVTPWERIVNLMLNDDELKGLREKSDEKERKRRAKSGEGLQEISADPEAKDQSGSTGAGYQRQDFLDDLRAVTHRTDSDQSDPEA